jgi:DNA-binding YbaB/EbfC family protein
MKDIMGLMKQAQGLQQKMTDVQAELASVEVEGVSGGGMVKVVATAKGDVKSVTIDPSLMVAEDREILEDLLVTALNDVRTRAERVAQQRMEEVTRGLPLPPGLKLF